MSAPIPMLLSKKKMRDVMGSVMEMPKDSAILFGKQVKRTTAGENRHNLLDILSSSDDVDYVEKR